MRLFAAACLFVIKVNAAAEQVVNVCPVVYVGYGVDEDIPLFLLVCGVERILAVCFEKSAVVINV